MMEDQLNWPLIYQSIIQSYNTTLQKLIPIQITISDINDIIILSYQKNSKSYHLLYFSMQGRLKNFVQVNMNQYTEIPIQNNWLLKLQNNNFIVFFHIGSLTIIVNQILQGLINWEFQDLQMKLYALKIVYLVQHLKNVIFVVLVPKKMKKLNFVKYFMLTDCDVCSNGFQLNEFRNCVIIDQSIEHPKDPQNPSYQEEVKDRNSPGVPTDPVDPINIKDPTDPSDRTSPQNPINIGTIIGDKCNVIMQNKLINFVDNRYVFIQICNEIMSAKLFNKDGVEIQSFVIQIELVIFYDTVLVQDQIFLAFFFTINPTSSQIFLIDNSFQNLNFRFEANNRMMALLQKQFEKKQITTHILSLLLLNARVKIMNQQKLVVDYTIYIQQFIIVNLIVTNAQIIKLAKNRIVQIIQLKFNCLRLILNLINILMFINLYVMIVLHLARAVLQDLQVWNVTTHDCIN
ncbi:unnamed protein product [Paramecium pentaurelia]|uniref:Transmembrane protein n=1 Tax=Paramecium pentaurelia TaxID=43138 RepID=A0A8S1YHH3_9CILI|nr:unnamed protein product [Paramecium pentaurelia]